MKIAGWLAVAVAVLLLGMSFSAYRQRANSTVRLIQLEGEADNAEMMGKNDAIRVSNDELSQQIAMLKGHHVSQRQLEMDQQKVNADRLAASLTEPLLDQALIEDADRAQSIHREILPGMAFLVAGIALIAVGRRKETGDEPEVEVDESRTLKLT